MKNRILIILILFTSTTAFAQSALSWYREYDGKVGNYSITMHLHRFGNDFAAFYYYKSREQPIYLYGESSEGSDSVVLAGYPDIDLEEYFYLKLGETIRGTWTNGSKSLDFIATPNLDSGRTALDYVYASGTRKLVDSMLESPLADYHSGSIWPKGNTPFSVYLKRSIGDKLGHKNVQGDIGKLLLADKHSFLDTYISDNKDLSIDELRERPYSYNLSEVSRILVVYESPKVITIAHTIYTYTGGAHGNYSSTFTSYDKFARRVLKLTDVLTQEGILKLPALLEKYFRIDNKLIAGEPLTEGGLFENSIAPNENFYITGKMLGFCYVPYEIGPYARGEIKVFIPVIDVARYLTPTGRKLLDAN